MIFQPSRIPLPILSFKCSFTLIKTRTILKLMSEMRFRVSVLLLLTVENAFKYPNLSFLNHKIGEK